MDFEEIQEIGDIQEKDQQEAEATMATYPRETVIMIKPVEVDEGK